MRGRIEDSGSRERFMRADGKEAAQRDNGGDKVDFLLVPFESMSLIDEKNYFYKDLSIFLVTRDIDDLVRIIKSLASAMGYGMATLLEEIGIHYDDGANKYEPYNWQKGMPWSRYLQSGLRHFVSMFKWLETNDKIEEFWKGYSGEKVEKYIPDPDDERHDRALLWNLVCLVWSMEFLPEFDDLEKALGPERSCQN